MRSAFRLVLSALLAVAAASGTRAQQPEKYSRTNVFTFAPVPAPPELTEIPRDKIDEVLGAQAELKLRPNVSTELYLWVLNPNDGNPAKDRHEFVVEMEVARGGAVVRQNVVIPARTWARVRLPKPPAPTPPPAAATPVVAAPAAPAKPAAEPPPPGVELPLAGGQSLLTFRLLDKSGKEIPDAEGNGKPFGRDFRVSLRPLSDYVQAPDLTITPSERDVRITATVKQKPFPYPGSAAVQLVIPPQETLSAAMLREGFYRRTLIFDTAKDAKENSVMVSGRVENPGKQFRVYVGIDGIDRAYGYTLNLLGTTPKTQIIPETAAAVRVSRVVPRIVTAPIKDYPVRVEVDNPGDGDTLELRLHPVGGAAELTEIIKLDSVRDNRIWLEPAGPTDGGLLFTTRSRDWIKPLDLSHLQGRVEVYGALKRRGNPDVESDRSLVLTVDGTPPEPITFLRIPRAVEKGKPLVLRATVNDPDTDVTKATFFLFRAFDDGKIPADAIKAVGTQSLTNPRIWTANVPIPADFRGDGLVAAVFANEAGLVSESPLVQRIEIVDPQPPTGTIEGKVTFGERFQPGVSVSLRDADGKEKAATTTDEKGRFAFARTPIGTYRLIVIKRDSSSGASGTSPVVVEADKTTKVTVALEKIRR
jgi:carboxypeptidase family protein